MAPAQRPYRSRQDYATPDALVAAVARRLGIARFQHDFAANYLNSKGVTHYDEASDALQIGRAEWRLAVGVAGWGWLNPPFSDIAPWAKRCAELKADGGRVAMLVPASIGANWFREFVNGRALVLALNGRIQFSEAGPYPKDCMLCLFGLPPGFQVWSWKERKAK